MADGRRTLFELHLHDADIQVGPRSVGLGGDDGAGEETDAEDEADAGSRLALAVGLLVVAVVVALVLRRLLAEGDLDAVESLDDDAASL